MSASETVLCDSESTGRHLDEFLAKVSEFRRREGDADERWGIIGIHRRGDILARRLCDRLREEEGAELPLGVLDITLYRDDFYPGRPQPTVRPSTIPFPVEGASLLLVDDVFQTGRTARAALTQLADFGRARRIVFAVFVDRRLREIPICPDLVGLVVERPANERVQLRLQEIDGADRITSTLAPAPPGEGQS